MASKALPSSEVLRQRIMDVLDYNPTSGVFVWKQRPGLNAKERSWNTRYSGRPAGAMTHGYFKISVDDKKFYAHRLAWLWTYGQWPECVIDHIDRNGLNNAISNLRDATKAENIENTEKVRRNKTGFSGVVQTKSNTFYAQKVRGGQRRTSLVFKDASQAHAAFMEM